MRKWLLLLLLLLLFLLLLQVGAATAALAVFGPLHHHSDVIKHSPTTAIIVQGVGNDIATTTVIPSFIPFIHQSTNQSMD